MQHELYDQQLNNIMDKQRTFRKWWGILLLLCSVTVFCTIYALIMPAKTMVTDDGVTCGFVAHTHDESCYTYGEPLDYAALTEGHIHGAGCYNEFGECVCGYADYFIHSHDETCYDESGNLICTLPEVSEHQHDDSCIKVEYQTVEGQEGLQLVSVTDCAFENPEYHIHTESCYDLNGNLICGRDEVLEAAFHRHTAECYENGILVCGQTQILRYQGSEQVIADSGKTLICDIPEHEHDMGCFPSAEQVQESEQEETLICGFETEHQHNESCYDGDTLICSLPEHIHDGSCYGTAQTEEAAEQEEALEYICGFVWEHTHTESCYCDGELICDIPEHTHTADCLGAVEPVITTVRSLPAADGAVAEITGILPDNAECMITAVQLSEEELTAYLGDRQAESIRSVVAYDIKIMSDGVEWQPDESVSVSVLSPGIEAEVGDEINAAHIDGVTEEISSVDAVYENDGINFTAEGFSTYIFFTVDFVYDGYEYSLNGMESITLSELFGFLGIEKDFNDILSVTFTNDELIKIEQIEGDWLLTSLAPFNSEETLTVEFADHSRFVIDVTDAIHTPTIWERVSTIDDTSAQYIIVDPNTNQAIGFSFSFELSLEIINYSPAHITINFNLDTDNGYYYTDSTVPNNNLWTFSNTGNVAQATNVESYLSAGLNLASTGDDNLVSRTKTSNTLTYDPATEQFTISYGSNYLQYNNGFTCTANPSSGNKFYIYKKITATTTYNSSSHVYTIPVFAVEKDSAGNVISTQFHSYVQISSSYTSSSPFRTENYFNNMGIEGEYQSAYIGMDGDPDLDDVSSLYITPYTTGIIFQTTHYPLSVFAGGTVTERYLNEVAGDNALFIVYQSYRNTVLPNTGGTGVLPIILLGIVCLLLPVISILVFRKKKCFLARN